MSRAAIWIVNGALLVLGCFLTARVLTAIAAEALVPPAVEVAPPALAATPGKSNWDERQVILTRNLFNVSTLAPPAPATPAVAEDENYEKTRLPLRLLGTAAGDPERSLAAVEDLDTREHHVVRLGDKLQGKAEIRRIERRRIVLLNAGRMEELSLEEEQAGGAGGDPQRQARRASRGNPRPGVAGGTEVQDRIRQLGQNRFALDREDVESVARNPAALFSQATIVPKYENGQMKGLELRAIKPDSIFAEIGIQNGDVITEFNGIQVNSPQENSKVLRELTEANQFRVTACDASNNCRELFYEVQ